MLSIICIILLGMVTLGLSVAVWKLRKWISFHESFYDSVTFAAHAALEMPALTGRIETAGVFLLNRLHSHGSKFHARGNRRV